MAKAKKTDSLDKLVMDATARKVFGKKLKRVRKDGFVPANIYGTDFKSTAVSVPFKEFVKVFRTAKETGIVYVMLEKQELPILIKNVQVHPVTNQILHADFRKIDLAKKIQTEVPVVTKGTSEAVTQKAGILLTQSETLLVESLPKDIPKAIEIDISVLKEIGQEIKVSDLAKSAVYEIKTPAIKVVVSVVAHKEESVTPEITPTAAPEVITEKVTEGEEAATPGAEAVPTAGGKQPEAKPQAGTKPEAGKSAAPSAPKTPEKK